MSCSMHVIRSFLLLILLVGCEKKSSSTAQSSSSQRYLNVSFATDVRSFDPRIGIDGPSAFSVKILFEGLMRFDMEGNIQPAIAHKYDISPDGKTYTFYLRIRKWQATSRVRWRGVRNFRKSLLESAKKRPISEKISRSKWRGNRFKRRRSCSWTRVVF